jgi:hypothetical protein
MKPETWVLLAVLAYVLFRPKSPAGPTGIIDIHPVGGGPLFQCCSGDGMPVYAGNSMYCPEGTTIC